MLAVGAAGAAGSPLPTEVESSGKLALITDLTKSLLRRHPPDLRGYRRALLRFAGILWASLREFSRDYCFEKAATLSFATIISLMPLAVLLVGVAVQFGLGDLFIEYAEQKVFPNLAPAFKTELSDWLANNISRTAFSNSTKKAVGFLALVSLISTAMGGFTAAERIFNRLWRVTSRRSYFQKLMTFWAILTLSPFVMTASLGIKELLVPGGGIVEQMTQSSVILRGVYDFLVPTTVVFAGFSLLFKYLPSAVVRWRSAVLGGFLAACLFELSTQAFIIYVARSSTIASLYGPLSIVPFFLVWVFVNWVIVLWGCVFAYAHQNFDALLKRYEERDVSSLPPPTLVGLYLLEKIAAQHDNGGQPPSLHAVADELTVPEDVLEGVARKLVERGILVEDARRPGVHCLAVRPELVRLSQVDEALREDVRSSTPGPDGGPSSSRAFHAFRDARREYLACLDGKSLADLAHASELKTERPSPAPIEPRLAR
jgi:YihY family inner membrane protein